MATTKCLCPSKTDPACQTTKAQPGSAQIPSKGNCTRSSTSSQWMKSSKEEMQSRSQMMGVKVGDDTQRLSPQKPHNRHVVFSCSASLDALNSLSGVLIRVQQVPVSLMCDTGKMLFATTAFFGGKQDPNYVQQVPYKNTKNYKSQLFQDWK